MSRILIGEGLVIYYFLGVHHCIRGKPLLNRPASSDPNQMSFLESTSLGERHCISQPSGHDVPRCHDHN